MKKVILMLVGIIILIVAPVFAQDCQTVYNDVYSLLTSAKESFDADDTQTGLDLVAQAQEALQPCTNDNDCPVSRLETVLSQVVNAPANSRVSLLNGAITLLQECGVEAISAPSEAIISLANIDRLALVSNEMLPLPEGAYTPAVDMYLETDEWMVATADTNTNVSLIRYTPTIGWSLVTTLSTNRGEEFFTDVEFSGDGNFIFFSAGYNLLVIDVQQQSVIANDIASSYSSIADVAVSPTGLWMAVAGNPNVVLYETSPIDQLRGFDPGDTVTSIGFKGDSEVIVGTFEGLVLTYSLPSFTMTSSATTSSEQQIMFVSYLPLTNQLLATSGNLLTLWDFDSKDKNHEIQLTDEFVTNLAISIGEDLAFIPIRGGFEVVDLVQGQIIATIDNLEMFPRKVMLTPDGEQLLLLSATGNFAVFAIEGE